MKRIRAHTLPLLIAFTCLTPALAVAQASLVPLPDRNPQRAVAPVAPIADPAAEPTAPALPEAAAGAHPASAPDSTGAIEAAALPDPQAPEAEIVPLPDRNPTTTSIPMTPAPTAPSAGPASAGSPMGLVSGVALPDRNPKTPSLLAPALPLALPAQPQVVTDMPLPDPNPSRAGTAMKGMLAPAIEEAPPAMDYAAILQPILSYRLSVADEANVRETIRSSVGRGVEGQATRRPGTSRSGTNIETARPAAMPTRSRISASPIPIGRDKTSCGRRPRQPSFSPMPPPTRSRSSSAPPSRRPARAKRRWPA